MSNSIIISHTKKATEVSHNGLTVELRAVDFLKPGYMVGILSFDESDCIVDVVKRAVSREQRWINFSDEEKQAAIRDGMTILTKSMYEELQRCLRNKIFSKDDYKPEIWISIEEFVLVEKSAVETDNCPDGTPQQRGH